MFPMLIRYFSIILNSTYIFFKISNSKPKTTKDHYYIISVLLIISSIFPSIIRNNYSFRVISIYIAYLIFISIYSRNKLHISIINSIISFSMSYVSLSFASLIVGIMLGPFNINISKMPEIYYVILSSILHLFIVKLTFQIKRFKNGMPFLNKRKLAIFISLFGLLIIISIIIMHIIDTRNFNTRLKIMLIMFFFALALLIWWRRKLTQSYVEKLRVSEVEALYKEISDRDLEIEKLLAHNEQLAKIIHKDNKLIPAMELAVRNYLQTATLMKSEDAKQMGTELLAKLERMSSDRTGIIRNYQENNCYRQRTGLASIDAIVDYMENRALSQEIEYHYQYDKGIKEKLSAYISEDDAMHLLSDLIENAIVASTHNEKKTVHIHIGFIQDILFIDISDSGIPFAPETYQNLGMLQHTTHAEHGGSGIGLMDIWRLKKQYKFSLHIYEYPSNEEIYTKKIRILFDRKDHYLIQSYRVKEILSVVMRNGLHVLPYNEKEKLTLSVEKSKRRS